MLTTNDAVVALDRHNPRLSLGYETPRSHSRYATIVTAFQVPP